MDCVNHSGVDATAYCQNCGKALCTGCVRNAAGGQVLCEPCWVSWQTYQPPFPIPHSGGPHPATAAVLGVIPGVGAMYNGQFFKGFIHVAVFAVLISLADKVNGIFGLFIAAWIIYQPFEAYHTAKAMRDGQPLPDALRLNELASWLNLGGRPRYAGQPDGSQPPFSPGAAEQGPSGPTATGYPPPYPGQYPPPYQTWYQPPYPQTPFTPPAPGFVDPAAAPVPPQYWRRTEPVGAIVLIGLGILFLLSQLDIFNGRLLEFSWPVALIALGVWLVVRRLRDSRGDLK